MRSILLIAHLSSDMEFLLVSSKRSSGFRGTAGSCAMTTAVTSYETSAARKHTRKALARMLGWSMLSCMFAILLVVLAVAVAVAVVAVVFTIRRVAPKAAGALFERLRLSAVIGELVAGGDWRAGRRR